MDEIKCELLDDKSMAGVKRSLLAVSAIDNKGQFRANTLEYIDDTTYNEDDKFFWEKMKHIRYLDPSDDAIAFTDRIGLIYLNSPGIVGENIPNWEFIYDHECLHQLWETFAVADQLKKDGIEYNHELLNIASDCVINDYLARIRKKKMPTHLELITPELLKNKWDIDYDPKVDTQYGLYIKMIEKKDKILNDPFIQRWKDKELIPKSIRKHQGGGSPPPPPPPGPPPSKDFVQGWVDAIDDVTSKKVDPLDPKLKPKSTGNDDYDNGYNSAMDQMKKGLEDGIDINDGPQPPQDKDSGGGLPPIPWKQPPSDQKQSGGGGGGSSSSNEPEDQAQDAADKAKDAANKAQDAADKADDTSSKSSAQNAADRAKRAARDAQDAADQAKKAAANGDKQGAEDAAKKAADAAKEAADAARDASDAVGGDKDADTAADAADAAANKMTPAGKADDAVKRAKDAANNADEAAGKSGDKKSSDAAKKAKAAADEAEKQAEIAKRAQDKGNNKAAEEAARKAIEAADEAERQAQEAGAGVDKSGNKPNNVNSPSKGWGPADAESTPPLYYEENPEEIAKESEDFIKKFKDSVVGEFGNLMNKMRKSVKGERELITVKAKRAGQGWEKNMDTVVNVYLKRRLLKLQLMYKKAWNRPNRRQGVIRPGEFILPGKKRIEESLPISFAIYIDRSVSMGDGSVRSATESCYTLCENIKKKYSSQRNVGKMSFKIFAWDTGIYPVKYGNFFNCSGSTMPMWQLIEVIEEHTNDCLVNIVLTDGEFDTTEEQVKKALDKVEGIIVFIINQPKYEVEALAKKFKNLHYIQATADFGID